MNQSEYDKQVLQVQVLVNELALVKVKEVEPPPPSELRVDIAGPSEAVVGESNLYTISATGGTQPYAYFWNNGNGALSSIFKWDLMGEKQVSCLVRDSGGQESTASMIVNIKGMAPPLGQIINVGPGAEKAELHDLPLNNLQQGTLINLLWRATPYATKPVLQKGNGLRILGVSVNGSPKPILSAENARENSDWATDWTSALVGKGLITIVKKASGDEVGGGLTIENLTLRAARAGVPYIHKSGAQMSYGVMAAGIYMTTCRGVKVVGCTITDNDNGILGISNSGWSGPNTTRDLLVAWNAFSGNGVPGSYSQHSTYVEGVDTIYEFNSYSANKVGSPGTLLKDRGAGTKIRYSIFDGPSTLPIDLVEPEAGAPVIMVHPTWGNDYIYGCILRNNQDCSNIHYGFDGVPANKRRELHFYHNTLRNRGDFWKFNWFRVHGSPTKVRLYNSIFWDDSADQPRMYAQFDGTGTYFSIGGSWMSEDTLKAVNEQGVPINVDFDGWNWTSKGVNPGVEENMTLLPNSVCKFIAQGLPVGLPPVQFGWDGTTWVRRNTWTSAGASE